MGQWCGLPSRTSRFNPRCYHLVTAGISFSALQPHGPKIQDSQDTDYYKNMSICQIISLMKHFSKEVLFFSRGVTKNEEFRRNCCQLPNIASSPFETKSSRNASVKQGSSSRIPRCGCNKHFQVLLFSQILF